MHDFSVLVATLGEFVIKPLVWPLVFLVVAKGVAALLTENKNTNDANS